MVPCAEFLLKAIFMLTLINQFTQYIGELRIVTLIPGEQIH